MKKRLMIESVNIIGNRLLLNVNDDIKGLLPGEQILVDSQHFSFIYLMEDQEEYTYIVLPEKLWPQLKSSLVEKNPVWIAYKEDQVELTNFHEELEYVLSNIKDNSNYGDEMVAKVDKFF